MCKGRLIVPGRHEQEKPLPKYILAWRKGKITRKRLKFVMNLALEIPPCPKSAAEAIYHQIRRG